jgi:5-methyltetrahydrofolate--homocysteine methyltransferase
MDVPVPDLALLHDAVLTGNAPAAVRVVEAALAAGGDPEALVTGAMIPAMTEVGRRFEDGDYFVPELLISARAMKSALEILRPLLTAQGVEPVGRVVIGTMKGDLHDIGKGLVASMLQGGGFEVTDLGVDVAPERFIASAREADADIIALSALLTTTMLGMRSVVEHLEREGLRSRLKVIVGGAPVTRQFADSIRADGYSDTASGAVALARRLVVGSRESR